MDVEGFDPWNGGPIARQVGLGYEGKLAEYEPERELAELLHGPCLSSYF